MIRILLRTAGCIICLLCLLNVSASAKTLKIGTDNWPPYEELTNNERPGFSTEVVRHVLKKMGFDADIREYPWVRALKYVYDGKTEALFSAFFDRERAEHCYFPDEPLIVAKYVMFIRSEDANKLKFESYKDLTGKRVGIVRGASYPEEFWKVVRKQNNYQEVATEELNFKKLVGRGGQQRRVDYIIAEHGNGLILIKKLGFTGKIVPILSKSVREENVYAIFSKKRVKPEFVKQFSKTLKEFKSTDYYNNIYKKYFEITGDCIFPDN